MILGCEVVTLLVLFACVVLILISLYNAYQYYKYNVYLYISLCMIGIFELSAFIIMIIKGIFNL